MTPEMYLLGPVVVGFVLGRAIRAGAATVRAHRRLKALDSTAVEREENA